MEIQAQNDPSLNKEPRNLLVVVCHIAQLIPEDQKDFKNDIMNYIKNDLAYRDSYALTLPYVWLGFELRIMKKHIPTLDDANEQWKKDIIDLYTGKTQIPV